MPKYQLSANEVDQGIFPIWKNLNHMSFKTTNFREHF